MSGVVNVEKIAEVRALAAALYRLPPPARAVIANDLYELGARMHPEFSDKQVVLEGPENMGNWRPGHLETLGAMDIVRKFTPELASRIDAAKTEQDKAALRAEIREKYPDRVSELERHIKDMDDTE